MLANLKAEYDRWVLAKATAESDRERATVREKVVALAGELSKWEGRLLPLDEKLTGLRLRLDAHRRRYADAAEAIKGGGNRRKAELVRRLFPEIALHFEQVRRAKKVRTKFLPERTELKMTFMDDSSRRSCR